MQEKKTSNTNGQLNGFLVRVIVAKVIAEGATAQNSVESTKKTTALFSIAPILFPADICILEQEDSYLAMIVTESVHFE